MDKTDKQAVYDIATKLGYTGDEGPSVASAIYAVAQARGYEGACEGDASQALQALYTVVGGGGGGGDLGALQDMFFTTTKPVVGSGISDDGNVELYSLSIGDTPVLADGSGGVPHLAARTTASMLVNVLSVACDGYVTTINDENEYVTVAPWDGAVTVTEYDESFSLATFTVPALNDGETLVIHEKAS